MDNRGLDSASLSQLAFPGEKQPEFLMGEIPMGQYRCLKKNVSERLWHKKKSETELTASVLKKKIQKHTRD